jgi:pimeloyl-ACP methyl ester carboxylesterase
MLAGCTGAQLANTGMRVPDGLSSARVQGQPFLHQLLANAAFVDAAGNPGQPHAWSAGGVRRVHVYLDGDGEPWTGDRVREDPSPHGELVRRLLQRDSRPALYLGRPCHFTRGVDAACSPDAYTFGRYSPQVLDSLAAALASALPTQEGAALEVVLVAHSGGGSLAMLMAGRWRAQPTLRRHRLLGVLTIAANLDLAAWTRLHGHTPLHASLDPALQPALPQGVRQLHLVGGRDRVVPEFVVRSGLRAQPGAEVRVLPGHGHACCWLADWPDVLRDIERW